MGRIKTRDVKPRPSVERPEPLGRPTALQVHGQAIRSLKAAHGYGPPAGVPQDARPDTIGPHDAAIIRREEAARHAHWADDEL